MEKFKKIDWKYVIIASILITFFTFIDMILENKISFFQLTLAFVSVPVIVIILAFSDNENQQPKPRYNLLESMLLPFSDNEKQQLKPRHNNNYYISLTEFLKKDLVFYNEQLHQFTEDELDDYNIWLLKNYKNYNVKK